MAYVKNDNSEDNKNIENTSFIGRDLIKVFFSTVVCLLFMFIFIFSI